MKGKILVVEDNTDTRDLMHHYFKNAGFAVVAAVDGEEGLHIAKAERPDVIITDLAMPNMDGVTMIKQLRVEPTTAHIPVLIFTAHASVTPEEVVEAGADKAFYKPMDFDALVQIVRATIAPGITCPEQ